MFSRARLVGGLTAATVLVAGLPSTATAHGAALPAPDAATSLTAWSFAPLPVTGIAVALILYVAAVIRVDRAHPGNRVPRRRIAAWIAGLAVIAVALFSAIDVYATTLFTVHMVQHLLLTMVGPPLLALGAPITLLLRVAPPGVRRRVILPILHSAPVKTLTFPVVTWILFAGVMWASHFSALFDAALEDPLAHDLEHLLYLGTGMLFWWPVVGADPSPWRMGHGARIAYLALGMPQNTFLGLAIYSARVVLYPHYETLDRSWGPSPLADQQLAGGLMWVVGDFLFIIPLLVAVGAWMRAEEQRGTRIDEQLARERATAAAAAAVRSRTAAGSGRKRPRP
jgi:putative membrane protein